MGPTTTAAATQPLTGHHHGVQTGGPWRAVTSACPRHPLRARLQCLKRRAHGTKLQPRLRSIKWPGPLPNKEDPRVARAPGSERFDPQRVQASVGHLGARLKQNRHHRYPRCTILLISVSRADTVRDPRGPADAKTGAPSRHPVLSLLISISRVDTVRDPRGPADAKTGAPSRHPALSLLISVSRADTVRDPRGLADAKTGAPSRHPARPY
jgi:hypothetical protein